MKFLVEDLHTITDDNLNEYVNKYILPMSQQKVVEMAELELKDNFVAGPMFILPNGRLVDPADYTEFEGLEREDAIHQVVPLYLCDMIFDKLEMDFERDYGYYYDDYFLAQLTETFGWVRVNTGTGSTDFRCYVVIPSKDKTRLSSSQYYKLLDWLDYCQTLNKESVAIVTESGDKQNYSFNEYTPDEIISKIKRYYASGFLYENINKENVGYRTETTYGSGIRNLREILDFEIIELGNVDIPATIIKNFPMKNNFEKMLLNHFVEEPERYSRKQKYDIIKLCQSIILRKYPKAKYALWLADREIVKSLYGGTEEDIDEYKIEYTTPISDLGSEGKLYLYSELPEPINKE